ncbi:hypothetical protein GQ457_17G001130 [Hibiscus cannabinus]
MELLLLIKLVVVVYLEASGVIKVMFSCPVESIGSKYAEIMAILTKLSLIGKANWDGQEALVVESNSKLALMWILEKDQRLR